jgi:hypothetical protein
MAIPGVQDPKIPLGIELQISTIIASAMESLKKELNYGRPVYTAADVGTTPNTIANIVSSAMGTTQPTTIAIPTAGTSANSTTN